jgi:hypothetical protein
VLKHGLFLPLLLSAGLVLQHAWELLRFSFCLLSPAMARHTLFTTAHTGCQVCAA